MNSSEFKQRHGALISRVDQRDATVLGDIEDAIADATTTAPARCYLRSLLAFAHARNGDDAEAEREINALLPSACRQGLHDIVTQCHRVLADCAIARGDHLADREHCVHALAASRLCDEPALQFACELRLADVIGEWGRPEHAARMTEQLYVSTDWSKEGSERFHDATVCLLAWWLTRAGSAARAIDYLREFAQRDLSDYRKHVCQLRWAFARRALGEPNERAHLEALLEEAKQNAWHVAEAEAHLLLSYDAPDDSERAFDHATRARMLARQSGIDLRLMVLERAAECAGAGGRDEEHAALNRLLLEHLEAIMHAEAVSPLVCTQSGALLVA